MPIARGCYYTYMATQVARAAWVAIFLLFSLSGFAQNARDSAYAAAGNQNMNGRAVTTYQDPELITTFKALNFPPEMLLHYGQISPKDATTLIDEFQVTQKDEDGVPILITVRLHFDSDLLVGYITEAPIEKTIDVTVSSFTVKIPIEWLCTPNTPDHPQHYVSTLQALQTAEKQYKCTGWHIKLPDAERQQLPKKKGKKEKKPKKGKEAVKKA